jgi:serine/threonine protein kinase
VCTSGEDTRLGKAVAVKVLHHEYALQPKVVQRFSQEARAISRVRHPNVVDVTDHGVTPDGTVYLVMELLQGEDLSTTLEREGPLPWSRLGPIALQICAALATVHRAGIVHRDVKPSNCFRVRVAGNPDVIKVLDFGIAKVLEGPAALAPRSRPRARCWARRSTWRLSCPRGCGRTPASTSTRWVSCSTSSSRAARRSPARATWCC